MASHYEVVAPSTEVNDSTNNRQNEAEAVVNDEDERNMDEIAQAIGDIDVQVDNLGASGDDQENVADEEEAGDTDADVGLTSPTSRGHYTVPTGATPTTQTGALSSHAAEFWFPESRNCNCCNGFKHGCRCIKEHRLTACKQCACAYPATASLPPSQGNQVKEGSTFTPPAIKGPRLASNDDDEDERNMAELDKEIGLDENDDDDDEFNDEFPSEGKPGVVPSGAMPVQQNGRLSEHAAEFWFPNCRECNCCKGFKYGCPCTRQRGFLACQDSTCSIDDKEKGVKSEKPATPAQSPSNSSQMMCRFESMPGGCIYGSNCRYKHTNNGEDPAASFGYAVAAPVGSAGTYYGQDSSMMYAGQPPVLTRATTYPSVNDAAICRFFLNGGCMYGESCRYKHGY
jgi:hypothetical protein